MVYVGYAIFKRLFIVLPLLSFMTLPACEIVKFNRDTSEGIAQAAQIALLKLPPNHAPVAEDDSASLNEDGTLDLDVLANDSDPDDGDKASVSEVSVPLHGATAINLDGSIHYVPTALFFGVDSFSYTLSDSSGLSAVGHVSLIVNHLNHAPLAVDQSLNVNFNTLSSVVLSASDVDADSLIFTKLSDPQHGTLSGTIPNYSYTPTTGYVGSDSFTFRVGDGALASNVATVTITVLPYCSGELLTHSPYATGDGTSNNPFEICTATQFALIGETSGDWTSYFKLAQSIDLGGLSLTPIGTISTHFTGNFNGNSFTLSNISMSAPTTNFEGVFGVVGTAGVVSHLTLSNISVVGQDYVGALAGYNLGTLLDAKINGSLSAGGDIQGRNYVGGAVGNASSGTITSVRTNVTTVGSGSNVGGLAGYLGSTLSLSSAKGSVQSTRNAGCSDAGGLVGYAGSSSVISKSFATGSITATGAVVGGLVGWASGAIDNSYATGNVAGAAAGPGACTAETTQVFGGGLVGAHVFAAAIIQKSYATGNVVATGTWAGGISGLTFSGASAASSFSTGTVTASSYAGGATGQNNGGTMTNDYWDIFTSLKASAAGNGTVGGMTGVDTSIPANAGYFFDKTKAPLSSWDFSATWAEQSGDYPKLQWQISSP